MWEALSRAVGPPLVAQRIKSPAIQHLPKHTSHHLRLALDFFHLHQSQVFRLVRRSLRSVNVEGYYLHLPLEKRAEKSCAVSWYPFSQVISRTPSCSPSSTQTRYLRIVERKNKIFGR